VVVRRALEYARRVQEVTLRARLLGSLELEGAPGDRVSSWERPSARRLVALLLLSERRLTREEVAEALFPRLAPERAANGVAKALTMARRALTATGIDVLRADRGCIWIDEDVNVVIDLDEHERALAVALGAPPGPRRADALTAVLAVEAELLPEELYSDWTLPTRTRLERERMHARRELARELEAASAAPESRRLAWTSVLAEEPGDGEAMAALVAIEFSKRRPTTLPEDDAARKTGRELDLARLRQAATARGDPGRVLVTGPAGIGKTYLLERLRRTLEHDGWIVLVGHAVDGDRDVPLAALRSALAPLLGAVPEGSRLQSALAYATRPSRADDGTESAFAQLADEVAALLDAASHTAPLALVLDDAQWMDDDLVRLLARLSSRRGGRWAMIVGARDDEPSSPIPPLALTRVALRPLTRAATERLVRELLGGHAGSRLVADLARRSQGNPFYATELARAALDDATGRLPAERTIPASIVALLRRRLEQTPTSARRLCELVALLGEDADYEVVIEAADRDRVLGSADEVSAATRELLERVLLAERPGGLRVAHPLVREAIIATTPALERSTLHGLIADACEKAGLGSAVASHRLDAFEGVRTRETAAAAARAGLAAALEARSVHANAAAANLFKRSLAALEACGSDVRAELRARELDARLALGEILAESGRLEAAVAQFDAALPLAHGDEEKARAWSEIAGIPYRRGELDAAIATYEAGLAQLEAKEGVAHARLLSGLAWARYRRGEPLAAIADLRTAAETFRAAGDDHAASRGFDRLATALARAGAFAEALESSDVAFSCCARAPDQRELGILHLHRAVIFYEGGRSDEGLAEVARATRGLRGSLYLRSVLAWIEADLHEQRGDNEEALAASDREIELLAKLDNHRNAALAHARRARLLAALGQRRGAEEAVNHARTAAAAVDDALLTARVEAAIAGNTSGIAAS